MSVFITRVDDQQVFPYNFPLTRFLSLSRQQTTFPGKFWLCLQCLLVSGLLRKFGPSLMPSLEGTLLLEENRSVYKKRCC